MKLYTEEQIKATIQIGLREKYIDDKDSNEFVNNVIKYFKSIELPSDEEIEETFTFYPQMIEGAKWMKEQILNQNK